MQWDSFLFILESDATAITILILDGPGQARSLNSFDIAGPAKASGLTISKCQCLYDTRRTDV